MRRAKMAASKAKRKFRDPSSPRGAGLPQDDNKGSRHAPHHSLGSPTHNHSTVGRRGADRKKRRYPAHRRSYAYRSSSSVDRLEENHPGVRALVESLLRKRVRQGEICRQIYQKFGVRVSRYSLSRFFVARIQPKEDAEATAFRQAHAQARALIEEMKADPTLDAAKIAEIMLANQIVQDRSKLAEADIMDLYREQRERRKLELQQRALLLKEKQTRAVLEKQKGKRENRLSDETVKAIREIYGLSEPSPAAEAAGPENSP